MIKVNRLTPKAGTAAGPLAAAAAAAAAATAALVQTAAPAAVAAPTQAVLPTTPVLKPEEALQRASMLKLSLPDDLYGSSITALPVQEVQASAPFIGFASNRSPSWSSQQAAGLKDGDMYLQAPGGMLPLQECKFWMIDAFYCFTRVNDNNEILEAKSQLTEADIKADVYDDHYVCPIIVDTGEELLPAKLELRGARAAAAKQVLNAIQTAATPEWATSSDATRLAAAFPAPWGRQTAWMRVSLRQGRSTGRKYLQSFAAVRPSTLTDLEKLADATNDAAFNATLAEVRAAINERIEEMNAKAV